VLSGWVGFFLFVLLCAVIVWQAKVYFFDLPVRYYIQDPDTGSDVCIAELDPSAAEPMYHSCGTGKARDGGYVDPRRPFPSLTP